MRGRFITLNIGGTKDGWFEGRRDILIQGLAAQKPDVVCLQETTLCRGSAVYDQARDIGEEIGLPIVAFAPYGNLIEVMSPDQGGVAMISRWPILRVRNRRLPAGHEDPPDARVALFTTLLSPGGEFKVVTTHLSWEPEGSQIRLMQMGLILEDLFQNLKPDPHERILLLGDFNGIDTEPAIQLLRGNFQDCFRRRHPAAPGYTWNTSNPLTGRFPIANRRLDYIFSPPGAQVHSSEIILNHPSPTYASDHFGVIADLEWKEAIETKEAA